MKIPAVLDTDLTYYLAGPMSGYPEYNYPAFARAKAELEEAGVKVCSPHEIPWPEEELEGEELWQYMMRLAMRQLLDCRGIILMAGWVKSKGAVAEANVATALAMPAYFLDGKYLVPMHESETI